MRFKSYSKSLPRTSGECEGISSLPHRDTSSAQMQRFRNMRATAHVYGFTLVEILASAAIIAVLASIVLATIGGIKTNADRTVCVSNLRLLAGAMLAYTADHQGNYPAPFGEGEANSWDGLILPYLKDGATTDQYLKILQCPEDKRSVVSYQGKPAYPRSYRISSQPANDLDSPMGVVGYNKTGNETVSLIRRSVQVTKPADTIMLFENYTTNAEKPTYLDNWQFYNGSSMASGWRSARVTGYRADGSKKLYHGKVINYAMADGHVESRDLAWPYTPHVRWDAVR